MSSAVLGGLTDGQLAHSRKVPRTLSLTFDDGPGLRPGRHKYCTSFIADTSDGGTFFMVGERVLAEPDLAHRGPCLPDTTSSFIVHRHIRHTELHALRELRHDSGPALDGT